MSTVDYTAVAAGLSQAIPFNVHLGLETTSVAPDSGAVLLPDDEKLRNHVGSQHAGALFAAAEAASGAAFVGAFLDIMGEITASARFGEDADALKAKLREEGRVRFPVQVEMTDTTGNVVAEMTVDWYVRLNDAQS